MELVGKTKSEESYSSTALEAVRALVCVHSAMCIQEVLRMEHGASLM